MVKSEPSKKKKKKMGAEKNRRHDGARWREGPSVHADGAFLEVQTSRVTIRIDLNNSW